MDICNIKAEQVLNLKLVKISLIVIEFYYVCTYGSKGAQTESWDGVSIVESFCGNKYMRVFSGPASMSRNDLQV